MWAALVETSRPIPRVRDREEGSDAVRHKALARSVIALHAVRSGRAPR